MKPISIASLAITMSLVFVQDTIGWRGIVPLRATRTQVERMVGALNIQCQCYLTQSEIIRVKYARGPCKGDLAGWNVPADTVLSVEIIPKEPLLFSEIKARTEDFVKTVDDTVTTYYGNGEKGLRYSVTSLGTVASVWYGPSVKDNRLRCAGFPPTDGGTTDYHPYYRFSYETFQDVTGHLGEFGIRLMKHPEYKGYVIVYGAPDAKGDSAVTLVTSAKDYLIKELNVDSKVLEVINGGARETSTVELFLIPWEWPPPVPTPTLGGFIKK